MLRLTLYRSPFSFVNLSASDFTSHLEQLCQNSRQNLTNGSSRRWRTLNSVPSNDENHPPPRPLVDHRDPFRHSDFTSHSQQLRQTSRQNLMNGSPRRRRTLNSVSNDENCRPPGPVDHRDPLRRNIFQGCSSSSDDGDLQLLGVNPSPFSFRPPVREFAVVNTT